MGVLYRYSRFSRTLSAGTYWLWRPATQLRLVDMREAIVTVPSQELLTQDHVPVKLSVACRYAVADPAAALHRVTDYYAALYLLVQLALREAVASLTVEALLAARVTFGGGLLAPIQAQAREFGLAVRDVTVKDVILPAELKRAMSDLFKARQEAQTALERARGEQTALRSLANSARMLEDNPQLLQLRMLLAVDSAAKQQGVTLVLGQSPFIPASPPPPVSKQPSVGKS